MRKSFFDYSKEKVEKQNEDIKEKLINEIPEDDKKNIEDTVNKFSQMSQSELMGNLAKEISKQKQNGTFNAKKLENTIDSLGNFITPEQKKNIKELLNKFK